MNEVSVFQAITVVVGAAGVLSAAFLTHRWTLKREDRADRRLVVRDASSSLGVALHRIYKLVERSEVHPVPAREITEAVAHWEDAYRTHEALLPVSWRHIRGSVAAALGEHFGAVGASNLCPVPEDYPVASHDPVWWDRAHSYLQYVGYQLSRWGHRPMDVRKIAIYSFDVWLSQRRH